MPTEKLPPQGSAPAPQRRRGQRLRLFNETSPRALLLPFPLGKVITKSGKGSRIKAWTRKQPALHANPCVMNNLQILPSMMQLFPSRSGCRMVSLTRSAHPRAHIHAPFAFPGTRLMQTRCGPNSAAINHGFLRSCPIKPASELVFSKCS